MKNKATDNLGELESNVIAAILLVYLWLGNPVARWRELLEALIQPSTGGGGLDLDPAQLQWNPPAPVQPVHLARVKIRGFWRDQVKRLHN
mgnify:CR=1 FL=1